MNNSLNHLIGFLTVFILCSTAISADSRSGEQINWQVIAGGGDVHGTSVSYILCGTVGQTATGLGTTASYTVRHGFWQDFGMASGNCCLDWGIPGDANDDLAINLLDILNIIAYVYQEPIGEPSNPHGCDALLDCNGDGMSVDNPTINLLDILALIEHVYQDPIGNPALCCPPECQTP